MILSPLHLCNNEIKNMETEWILKLIGPIIKDCETPEEARKKVIAWGHTVEPRDAAAGLIMIDYINSFYDKPKE